ncbi:MAG: hypothetical protein KC609_19715 [Myxococcales bacterium]|nr:hypothetical protein [Myxococcales bacterium]
MQRKAFVLGGAHTPYIGKFHPDFIWKGHPDFGKRDNPSLGEYLRIIIPKALAAAGVEARAIDKGIVANFAGELFSNQGHLGSVAVAADPALDTKPFWRVEGACASGGIALLSAVEAVKAGADLVLVVGAEVQNTKNAKEGADYLARAADYDAQRSIDPFTFPCLFARRAKAYREAYGMSEETLAWVAVKAYANANKNPNAHMRTVKLDHERAKVASDKNPVFLSNPEYKDYLKVSDCSQVSDGASALVVASEEALERLGRSRDSVVEIAACELATSSIVGPKSLVSLDNCKAAADRAYARAGVNPDAIDVAEVHDCFSITEVMLYEALGFAAQGQAQRLLLDGATQIDGRIPVNTGGGLIGFGHPVGATGVKHALEVFRQMKGQCGDYQLAKTPQWGISANIGGDDRTAVVTIYRNL